MTHASSDVRVRVEHPSPKTPVGHLEAHAESGLDLVEIRLRWDGIRGTRDVLRLLARASIEVLVQARAAKSVPASREMEGSRWHG